MIVHAFDKELKCLYKSDVYTVRDNGSVFRHSRDGKRLRKDDNIWTFGVPNKSNGYMEITSVGIHKIIATAFHGERPSDGHVVDHIDTNRRNNRPANLRWVTRLENILLNPITAKRIALTCGRVEAFLANPKGFNFPDPSYGWMQTVSVEEAQRSLERLLAWAKSDQVPTSWKSLDEWIYNRERYIQPYENEPAFTESLTSNAIQLDWETPSEFPNCPSEITETSIANYAAMLTPKAVFSKNKFTTSKVVDLATSPDGDKIWVLCKADEEGAIKPWSLAEVTVRDPLFVHANKGSFFYQNGGEQAFTLAQGLKWNGGETFDEQVG